MTEQNVVSIEEVRVLVAERQRYDDWLTALEARRAETPARVFDRVYADYGARRADVLARLHTHVGGLTTLSTQLDQRLAELESTLASLEDERVEAMLRTAVGEFDDHRWEEVRAQVEERIASLGQERDGLLTEVDEVRTLLASARVEPDPEPEPEEIVASAVQVEGDATASVVTDVVVDDAADVVAEGTEAHAPTPIDAAPVVASDDAGAPPAGFEGALRVSVDIGPFGTPPMMAPVIPATPTPTALPAMPEHAGADEESFEDVSALFDVPDALPSRSLPAAEINLVSEMPPAAPPAPSSAELGAPSVEYDDALALFSDKSVPADPGFVKSLDGIEVEIDPPLKGRTQGVPDVSTATATPPSNTADPFDDLAFLRSVIDPGGTPDVVPPAPVASSSSAASSSARQAGGEPQKTLRCTECGTMNLPTEWYCERCGGELAAF